jgi:hypothetical protein
MDEVFPPIRILSFGDFLWWLAAKVITALADLVLWLVVSTGQVELKPMVEP